MKKYLALLAMTLSLAGVGCQDRSDRFADDAENDTRLGRSTASDHNAGTSGGVDTSQAGGQNQAISSPTGTLSGSKSALPVRKSKKANAKKTVQHDETSMNVEEDDTALYEEEEVVQVEQQDYESYKTQVSQSEKNQLLCPEDHSASSAFRRPDLAYQILGVDCVGDEPMNRTLGLIDRRGGDRAIASGKSCEDNPHQHPWAMRSDLAYHLTGLDCVGDAPGQAFNFKKGENQ